jgi:endonuclease/exonuclease/phosphatase family metal-dependent hydrolase
MGKLAVYKYAAAMFLTLQVVVSIFTLVGLFGGNVTPVGNTARAMCVYILPILIAANIVLIVYWIIRRKWLFLAIPVLTVACCIPYIGTYYQFSLENPQKNTQNGLKIASYNVAMFKRETSGFMAQDILAEMRRQKVDILCMQEYNEISGDQKNSESYKEYFPYQQVGRSDMVIFSRYPITGSKTILFEETNNSAMWADVNVNGKEFRVFNVHLETTGINGTLHRASKTMFQQHQEVDKSRLMNAIVGNYTLGLMFRSGQAITIANEKRESDKPTILCGDFNDVPYSFVYNTVKGDMVDGFKECGAGWMYTYRGMKNKPVRIDYIFHDESIKGLAYYKTDLTYSDHFPVFMKIALQ